MKNAASLLLFVFITSVFAAVNVFKTAVIKEGDPTLTINVAHHQFLRIYNFPQDTNTGTRGAVIAAAASPTATLAPSATPTATPTPSATPPPRTVLTASLVNPTSPPEPIKQVVIDGPAQ